MARKDAGNLCRIKTLNDVEPGHLHDLQEFHSLARNIACAISNNDSSSNTDTMTLGYHAIPSFAPLHLHIISSDLNSKCITNRKHIVSFTSPLFFVNPQSIENHLQSAFVDSLVLSVRNERAISARDDTPMCCPRCKRVAITVPDWKHHNEFCNTIPSNGEEMNGESYNSLLGWTSYITPMTPQKFTVIDQKRRYIIYMAIRERQDSPFARGLAKCKDACVDELKHCLQYDQTRHITMWDGYLTADQVHSLQFRGTFDPIDIEFDGWPRGWDTGVYLSLSAKSQNALQDLLTRLDGLPFVGGKRPCNHLSLYRRRDKTILEYSDMKREFAKTRAAWTRDHGSVKGVSIRIGAHRCSYDETKILADVHTNRTTTEGATVAATTTSQTSIADALQSSYLSDMQPIHLSLPWEEKTPEGKEKLAAVIPGVLSSDECSALIEKCEEIGFDQALLNVGGGREVLSTGFRKSLRCIVDDAQAANIIWERLKHVIPETITKDGQSWHRVGLNERFRVLKYEVGDYFKPHTDGSYERQNGDMSLLTLMLYLNTPISGGDTNFLSRDGGQVRTVNPCTGQGLVFDHSIRHESEELEIGTKYAIRTDVMYRCSSKKRADQSKLLSGRTYQLSKRYKLNNDEDTDDGY